MAAEVLGVVSSSIAVAGVAGNLIKSTMALKQLWDQFQDVPDIVRWQLDHLDLFSQVLSDMEESFRQSPAAYSSIGTSDRCLDLCKKILNLLNTLTEDLQRDLESTSKVKRNKARAKALLKADTMQRYRERLAAVIQMLMSCQLIYQTSLLLLQPSLIAAELDARQRQLTPQQQTSRAATTETKVLETDTRTAYKNIETTSLIAWQTPGICGSIQHTCHAVNLEYDNRQTYRIRIQLPMWMAGRSWDFCVERAQSGWKMAIRPKSIFKRASASDYVVKASSFSDLVQIILKDGYSIHDCDSIGQTVLWQAIAQGEFIIALDLIKSGASLTEPDKYGMSPFSIACNAFSSVASNEKMKFFQQLAMGDQLDELADLPFYIDKTLAALDCAMWSDVRLFDLIVEALTIEAPKPVWDIVLWDQVVPLTLLVLFKRHGFPDSTEYYMSCLNAKPISIATFVRRYLCSVRYISYGETMDIEGWRALCRLAFRHMPLAKLSIPVSDKYGSPIVSGLNHSWKWRKLAGRPRLCPRKEFEYWLEDIQTCGLDLEAYGKCEKSLLASQRQYCDLSETYQDGIAYFRPKIEDLDYGRSPKDWTFYWQSFGPEYAREFWELVDPAPLVLPGSWVD